ncbi:hypothetical protein NGM99_12615 [Mesorhizobium sp. RP14(2022)]|uniref:Phage tail protein n=1 Tax=Mesorhizobium liriopis TaxID=2953882 RepID=A0ABT1C8Z4_9HYPH|nr:hypothetical protein [Mesorhizobium liriopis]MCO6050626.1 hypothetical protein [Mesorhizobium liriopis]
MAFMIQADDFARVERMLNQMPADLKAKVAQRALGRVRGMMKTQIARHASQRTKAAQHLFKGQMTVGFANDAEELQVRTRWLTRYKQTAGKAGRLQAMMKRAGRHHGAFVQTMKSGHVGVFMRTSDKRLPIRELYGVNIAEHINRNLDEYAELVIEIADKYVVPRLLHEMERAISIK